MAHGQRIAVMRLFWFHDGISGMDTGIRPLRRQYWHSLSRTLRIQYVFQPATEQVET